MRIHTNTLTIEDIRDAARQAGATLETLSEHNSRKRHHAFEVKMTGLSRRRPNGGNRGAADAYAATWDQWGVFLGILFDRDGTMTATYYKDAEDFGYRTNWRFEGLDGNKVPFSLSHDHRWESVRPGVMECANGGCDARQNTI